MLPKEDSDEASNLFDRISKIIENAGQLTEDDPVSLWIEEAVVVVRRAVRVWEIISSTKIDTAEFLGIQWVPFDVLLQNGPDEAGDKVEEYIKTKQLGMDALLNREHFVPQGGYVMHGLRENGGFRNTAVVLRQLFKPLYRDEVIKAMIDQERFDALENALELKAGLLPNSLLREGI